MKNLILLSFILISFVASAESFKAPDDDVPDPCPPNWNCFGADEDWNGNTWTNGGSTFYGCSHGSNWCAYLTSSWHLYLVGPSGGAFQVFLVAGSNVNNDPDGVVIDQAAGTPVSVGPCSEHSELSIICDPDE